MKTKDCRGGEIWEDREPTVGMFNASACVRTDERRREYLLDIEMHTLAPASSFPPRFIHFLYIRFYFPFFALFLGVAPCLLARSVRRQAPVVRQSWHEPR